MTEASLTSRVSVAVPVNLDRAFDYHTIPNQHHEIGSYVTVPFGKKTLCGIVWGKATDDIDATKLKTIHAVHHTLPPLKPEHQRFIQKVAGYNCSSLGNALKLALPINDITVSAKQESWLHIIPGAPACRMTDARNAIIKTLHQPAQKQDVLDASHSRAVIKGLIDAGIIREETRAIDYSTPPSLAPTSHDLVEAQQQAVNVVSPALGEGFSRFLLDGATGSGKTEVYFELAERVIRQGKQALILLPEIALSMQIVERATKRFGFEPTLWHSSVSPAKRKQSLLRIMHGGAPLIIGARSALFLPYNNLGLVIVDEEHDASYKQDDGVMYHGRDMAVMRAHEEKIPIILASATPSLETAVNAQTSKYHHLPLHRRDGQAALPTIHLLDMKQEKLAKQTWLSPSLRNALSQTLQAGKQSLLFLNRRGYAPLLLCRSCGHRYACPSCSAWLVYHHANKNLQCHHCGLSAPLLDNCPECGAGQDKLAICGPGVERIEEEARSAFPEANILVLSGDSNALQDALTRITAGDIDIIIGTQLLAKGHHFPALATVGVIDADAGLAGHDIRAGEKTYQLLHQLAGRAGREQDRGNVYIQTYKPDHPLMQALAKWDRDGFVALECEHRRMTAMPPYGRLAALIIEGKPEERVTEITQALAQAMPRLEGVMILGPAPAPLYKLRNLYRMRFLIRAPKHIAIQSIMQDWRARIKLPSTVQVKIDIDPINFM